MTTSATIGSAGSGKHTSNLWKQAYQGLSEHPERGPRLERLKALLKRDLGKPHIKLRSDDGVRELLSLMEGKKRQVESRKSTAKIQAVCSHINNIKDVFGAAADAGGPYVAIPVAALFSVFAMNEIYVNEKATMFKVATTVSDCVVLFPDPGGMTEIEPGDSFEMRGAKDKLQTAFVSMYQAIIFATAQLALSSNSDYQWIKGVVKHYDWEGQLEHLLEEKQRIFEFKLFKKELDEKNKSGTAVPQESDSKSLMGPALRNPLHIAAALGNSSQVLYHVQKQEYPINALTMKRWTAAHLAAREGHTKILTTLMTAPGIDLLIKNREERTPLHIAALYNHPAAARVLLETNPLLLKARDQWKRTAFLIAAEKGHHGVLKVLRQYGQDMNETTVTQGWTALHLAAENGHVEALKWLTEHGTKKWTTVRDGPRQGLTAKQIAEQKGRTSVLEYL